MKPIDVELHIEEMVLHGFAPGDRHRIADAVESELAELFTNRDVPPSLMQSAEFARLDAGTFNVASNAKAGAVGGQVARAVYEGLIR